MSRFAIVALYAAASLAGVLAMDATGYGMKMSERAYNAVCWYENLKQFPETNTDGYTSCGTLAAQIRDQIENPSEQNKAFFKMYPDNKAETYGQFMNSMTMNEVPSEYKTNCGKFLDKPSADATSDESDALNDKSTHSYPLKAFANCMMHTLREKHGDEAIEAVKNERTHKKKHWMQTLLDRENEFRARHGAKPLKLAKDLVTAAQEWSEDNAAKCESYHSKNEDPRRQWRGQGTGESLSAGPGPNDIAAYIAADGWYEEVKDYPWPEYKGDGNDAMFEKIGHFTQSVWQESEYVGYGYAFNENCGMFQAYVTARYSPAGNLPGAFGKNVKPAQL